jgi:hypothetical protein
MAHGGAVPATSRTTTSRTAPVPLAWGPRASRRPPSTLALALLVMSVGNVATILLGPLVLGVVHYPISESVLNQLLGLEIVTLALVVPWSMWAAWLCRRGDPRGPALAIGPAAYTAYMLAQYVVGPEYATYTVVALAHVVLFSISLGVTIWSFALACRAGLPPLLVVSRRRWALVLAALAGVVAVRYLTAVVGSLTAAPIPTEFADARAFYWSIVLLDLGVVVPATILGAGAVWHGWAHARIVIAAVLGWFALVPPSVAAMATVMWVRDDLHASGSQTIVLWAITVVSMSAAILGMRQMTRGAAAPPARRDESA